MRHVGKELGNTPAVARSSYVSAAVIDQYLDGRTIEDFRPRHLRVVGARDTGLDVEEQALLSLYVRGEFDKHVRRRNSGVLSGRLVPRARLLEEEIRGPCNQARL